MVLLIPFASVLVLVNPLTIYLSHGYHQNLAYGSYSIWEAYSELLANSHGGPELHLWFLAVLMVYILIFLAFRKSIKNIAAWCEKNPKSHLLAPAVVALIFGAYWCGFCLSGRIINYHRLISPFVEDLPFFMIGAISAYSGTVLRRAQSFSPMLLILGISSWLAMELYRGPGWGPIQMFARGVLSICLVVLVNCIFTSYARAETKLTRFFSTSIYTVYLFHQFFLIATLAALGFHYNEPSSLQILILATGVTLAGAVFHRYVVAPVGILSLLFLGKRGLSAPAMISRTTGAGAGEG
jgi:thiol-disulfide isomerase/thioredoxin